MKSKKTLKIIFFTLTFIGVGWLILTLAVEATGPDKSWAFGDQQAIEKVLVVYDPDPFYNLDEQVCRSLAEEMANQGMRVKVASVRAARDLTPESFDALVFCSNTYNWAPDWAVIGYIEDQKSLGNKPVIAITLGAGSTNISQKKLEDLIIHKQGKIIGSRSLWLMRPNDESRNTEPNVQIALSIVRSWAVTLAGKIRQKN
jgi:flavorubredoxin